MNLVEQDATTGRGRELLSVARHLPAPVLLAALASLLVLSLLWALGSGAIDIPTAEIVGALWRSLTGQTATGYDGVVVAIRLPRVLMAALVGAGLAVGGATLQGLFRNPLADPGLIGVSGGAALGAVGMIVLGGSLAAGLGSWAIAAAAFCGSLAATLLVWLIGHRDAQPGTLLLAGIAINAISLSGVGWLTYAADDAQLRDLSFWSLGSLGAINGPRVAVIAPAILLPLLLLPRRAQALNALLLGEAEAAHLGFRPQRLQAELILLVALLVGAAVAFVGVISFVGLVVPHLLRLLIGPDHHRLLPAAALAGASLVVVADSVARTVVAPAELPLGVLTSLIGGPFFLWLLLRRPLSAH